MLRYIWNKQLNSLREFIYFIYRRLDDFIVDFVIDTSILSRILGFFLLPRIHLLILFLIFFYVSFFLSPWFELYWIFYSFYYFLSGIQKESYEFFSVFFTIVLVFICKDSLKDCFKGLYKDIFFLSEPTIEDIGLIRDGIFLKNYTKNNLIKAFFLFCIFIKLFCRNFYLFINYVLIKLKKFFVFIIGIFFHKVIIFIKFYFRKMVYNNVLWRPIFKKWSYFGFYASHRSKWLFRK